MRADKAAVESARLQVEYCSIYAPTDGRTGALGATPGNLVKQNDLPILIVINQISPIYMDFAIPEQYLAPVKKYMAGGRLAIQATPYGDTVSETPVAPVDVPGGHVKRISTQVAGLCRRMSLYVSCQACAGAPKGGRSPS